MTAIQGTNVAATIVPFDTADTHPTHDAKYGKGGWRSAATIAERDAIPAQRRTKGMIVRVTDDPTPANNGEWEWDGGAWVVAPLRQRVTDLEGRAATAEADIDTLDGRATALEGQATTSAADIDALEGRATALEGRADTAEGDIDSLEGRATAAEAGIGALEGRATALEGRATDAEADIDALDGRATALENRATIAEADITALEGRMETVEETALFNDAFDDTSEYVAVFGADEDGAVPIGIKRDGDVDVAGISVIALNNRASVIEEDAVFKSDLTDTDYLSAVVDDDGAVLVGAKRDGDATVGRFSLAALEDGIEDAAVAASAAGTAADEAGAAAADAMGVAVLAAPLAQFDDDDLIAAIQDDDGAAVLAFDRDGDMHVGGIEFETRDHSDTFTEDGRKVYFPVYDEAGSLIDGYDPSTGESYALPKALPALAERVATLEGGGEQVIALGGEYVTIGEANGSITDAADDKPYVIEVPQGIYAEVNIDLKDHVSVVGADQRKTLIEWNNPDDVDPATIRNYQPLNLDWNNRLEGITVQGRNIRYAIHSESEGDNTDIRQEFYHCTLRHFGNQGARDYQTGISGDPAAVWASEYAFGCGAASGQVVVFENSHIQGAMGGFLIHNNTDFTKPCRAYIRNSVCIGDNGAPSVIVRSMGSGVQDTVELIGNVLHGPISYSTTWLHTDPEKCPANRVEFDVYGHGNSPAYFVIGSTARALKIASAATSGVSTVQVSGDAVAALFGKEVYTLNGSGDADGFIDGYAYGWADISGNITGTALGARLGDCTTTAKTLEVVVDGGSAVIIAFNEDYTAQSNSYVISVINSALGSSAVASEYNISGRYRARMLDEEMRLFSETQGIKMGEALAYDGSYRKVRKMLSADPASIFAGIALEDIYPGTYGRVKTCGYVLLTDLVHSVSTPAFGDTLSISDPGKVVSGGTQALVTVVGVSPTVVRIGNQKL